VHGRPRGEQFRTEFLRLKPCPGREFGAADPGREAEVVLDARAGACLTSEGSTFD